MASEFSNLFIFHLLVFTSEILCLFAVCELNTHTHSGQLEETTGQMTLANKLILHVMAKDIWKNSRTSTCHGLLFYIKKQGTF